MLLEVVLMTKMQREREREITFSRYLLAWVSLPLERLTVPRSL